jgi:hypothetical protein
LNSWYELHLEAGMRAAEIGEATRPDRLVRRLRGHGARVGNRATVKTRRVTQLRTALSVMGGVTISAGYVFPFFRPLSAGVVLNYGLSPMRYIDLRHLGSLSIVSGEAHAEIRLVINKSIDVYFSAGAGFFYASLIDDPSSHASNLLWSGGIGVGIRPISALTLGISKLIFGLAASRDCDSGEYQVGGRRPNALAFATASVRLCASSLA